MKTTELLKKIKKKRIETPWDQVKKIIFDTIELDLEDILVQHLEKYYVGDEILGWDNDELYDAVEQSIKDYFNIL